MDFKKIFNEKKTTVLLIAGSIVVLLFLYVSGQYNQQPQGNLLVEDEFTSNFSDPVVPDDNLEVSDQDEDKNSIIVHIVGEVRLPGVYELEEGARVVDAVEKAGGETVKAGTDHINLAAKIYDGQKVVIPAQKKSEKFKTTENNLKAGDGFQNSEDGKTNLNRAGITELKELTGIGEVRARAIVEYREENGPFRKIEQLTEVKGIGQGILSTIEEELTY